MSSSEPPQKGPWAVYIGPRPEPNSEPGAADAKYEKPKHNEFVRDLDPDDVTLIQPRRPPKAQPQ